MAPVPGRLAGTGNHLFRRNARPNNWIAAVSATFLVKRAKTPANQWDSWSFHVQMIFEASAFLLTAKPSSWRPGTGAIQGALSSYAIRYFPLRTKRNLRGIVIPSFWFAVGELRNSARCARFITAFHLLAILVFFFSLFLFRLLPAVRRNLDFRVFRFDVVGNVLINVL